MPGDESVRGRAERAASGWGAASELASSSGPGPGGAVRPPPRRTCIGVKTNRVIRSRSASRSSRAAAGTVDLLCAAERLSTSGTTVSRGTRNGSTSWTASRLRRTGPGAEQVVDEGGHLVGEGDVRGIQGVRAPSDPREVDHADVVEVGEGDPPHLDEGTSVRRAGREEDAVDRFDERHETRGDVTDVDDPVVGEHGGVPTGSSRNAGSSLGTSRLAAASIGRQNVSSRCARRAGGRWSSSTVHRSASSIHRPSQPGWRDATTERLSGRRAGCGMPAGVARRGRGCRERARSRGAPLADGGGRGARVDCGAGCAAWRGHRWRGAIGSAPVL